MKYLYKLLIFSFITIFSSLSVSAQNAFTNPSFEGTQGMGIVPAPWVKCGVTTPDTQPNQFGIDLPPSDGLTYISVLSGSGTGTPEALSQNLSCPLKTGNRYSFTVDIAFDSSTFGGALEIWAGIGTCAKTQLLASVTPTANDVWQTKTITFIATSNWTSITFSGKSMPPPSRFILLDNLSPIMRTGPSGGATVTTVNASCDGLGNNDGSATVTAPADGTAWQYSWSPGGQTTSTITGLAPGTYTCTVSDPNDACSPIIVKANIYGPLPLTVSATPTTICSGQSSQLQASVAATPPPSCTYTLRLSKNGSAWAAPACVKIYLNSILSGTYYKTSTSLYQDFPINVAQGDAVQLEYISTGVVNGDRFHYIELRNIYYSLVYGSTATDVLTSGVKWNGVANCGYIPPTYTYSWSPSATLSDTAISNPVASPTVTTTYEVSVTSSNSLGCPTKKQITVIVQNASAIALTSAVGTNTQTVCQNTAITNITYAVNNAIDASVTGLPLGLTGTYASGIFIISGTPTVSGTFNYTVTTSGGCTPDAIATGTITVNTLPIITLTSTTATSNQTLCQNTAISNIIYSITEATSATVLGLPTGVTGTYTSGTFTISGTPTASGTYNYTVTTSGGCDTIATGTISVNPTITPTFIQVTPICIGDTLTPLPTTSNEGITGTWSPALNNTNTTTYIFTPDAGQCASAEMMIIEIKDDCEIPKGISPNGDGLNDVLDLSNFNITKLSIFNRYGMAAYAHGFGYKNQWYGQSNSGQELPDGTYFYVIDLVEGQTLTGWIYINRER